MGKTIHMGLSDDGFYHKEDLLKPAQFVEGFIGHEPNTVDGHLQEYDRIVARKK